MSAIQLSQQLVALWHVERGAGVRKDAGRTELELSQAGA
jgi:hypothetical protein